MPCPYKNNLIFIICNILKCRDATRCASTECNILIFNTRRFTSLLNYKELRLFLSALVSVLRLYLPEKLWSHLKSLPN
jgi:hypothetical protein